MYTNILIPVDGLEDPKRSELSSPNKESSLGLGDVVADKAVVGTGGAADFVGTGGADNDADAGLLDDPNNPPSSSPNKSDFFAGAAGTGAAGAADCVGAGGALLDPNNPPSSSPNRSMKN